MRGPSSPTVTLSEPFRKANKNKKGAVLVPTAVRQKTLMVMGTLVVLPGARAWRRRTCLRRRGRDLGLRRCRRCGTLRCSVTASEWGGEEGLLVKPVGRRCCLWGRLGSVSGLCGS